MVFWGFRLTLITIIPLINHHYNKSGLFHKKWAFSPEFRLRWAPALNRELWPIPKLNLPIFIGFGVIVPLLPHDKNMSII